MTDRDNHWYSRTRWFESTPAGEPIFDQRLVDLAREAADMLMQSDLAVDNVKASCVSTGLSHKLKVSTENAHATVPSTTAPRLFKTMRSLFYRAHDVLPPSSNSSIRVVIGPDQADSNVFRWHTDSLLDITDGVGRLESREEPFYVMVLNAEGTQVIDGVVSERKNNIKKVSTIKSTDPAVPVDYYSVIDSLKELPKTLVGSDGQFLTTRKEPGYMPTGDYVIREMPPEHFSGIGPHTIHRAAPSSIGAENKILVKLN